MQRQQTYRYSVPAARRAPAPLDSRRAKRYAPRRHASRAAGEIQRVAWVGAVVSVVGLLLAGGLLFALYLYFNLFGLIAPGVHVGQTRLGGLTLQRAAERLSTDWLEQPAIALSDGGSVWHAAPAQLGFLLDAETSIARAYDAGRSAGGWINPLALLSRSERQVAAAVRFDADIARERLQSAAVAIDLTPVEAALRFENGQWRATPGKPGTLLDVDATLLVWQSAPEAYLQAGLLPIKMRAAMPQVMDATPQAALLNERMHQPLRVEAFDPISGETHLWDVPADALAQWVRVDGEQSIVLDAQAVLISLESWQDQLGTGAYFETPENLQDLGARWQAGQPLELLVRHAPSAYVVQAGDNMVSIAFRVGVPFWMIQRANPNVNPNALSAGQTLEIPSLDDNLPLPVVRNKRIVISISQQRLWTYENGQQRSQSVISTGISRSPTMPGVFQIQSHELEAYASIWDLYMPHFLGIYEATPGFMNGIHGLPMLSSGVRLWGSVLGSPASYGCIIMTLDEAEDLYNWAEAGVVVEIQP